MTFSLRALALGALSLGLAACGTDSADAPEPLAEATAVNEAVAEIPAGTYALDPLHSELGFRVRHLGISNVDGSFNDFTGTITIPESGLGEMTATLTADVNSIDTQNSDRDDHLRSPDFFAAEEHPEITFQVTEVTPTGGSTFDMTGDLTMRGTTRPVTLQGEYLGAASIRGTEKIGFQAEGELNRQDWGLSWSQTNEAGEIIVGDTVTLMISAQADRQDAAAPEPAEADA